jgi:hypothetical protein
MSVFQIWASFSPIVCEVNGTMDMNGVCIELMLMCEYNGLRNYNKMGHSRKGYTPCFSVFVYHCRPFLNEIGEPWIFLKREKTSKQTHMSYKMKLFFLASCMNRAFTYIDQIALWQLAPVHPLGHSFHPNNQIKIFEFLLDQKLY